MEYTLKDSINNINFNSINIEGINPNKLNKHYYINILKKLKYNINDFEKINLQLNKINIPKPYDSQKFPNLSFKIIKQNSNIKLNYITKLKLKKLIQKSFNKQQIELFGINHYYIIQDDNDIISLVQVKLDNEFLQKKQKLLCNICTSPEWRGIGLATKLINRCLDDISQVNFTIMLWVNKTKPTCNKLIKYYQKLGFHKDELKNHKDGIGLAYVKECNDLFDKYFIRGGRDDIDIKEDMSCDKKEEIRKEINNFNIDNIPKNLNAEYFKQLIDDEELCKNIFKVLTYWENKEKKNKIGQREIKKIMKSSKFEELLNNLSPNYKKKYLKLKEVKYQNTTKTGTKTNKPTLDLNKLSGWDEKVCELIYKIFSKEVPEQSRIYKEESKTTKSTKTKNTNLSSTIVCGKLSSDDKKFFDDEQYSYTISKDDKKKDELKEEKDREFKKYQTCQLIRNDEGNIDFLCSLYNDYLFYLSSYVEDKLNNNEIEYINVEWLIIFGIRNEDVTQLKEELQIYNKSIIKWNKMINNWDKDLESKYLEYKSKYKGKQSLCFGNKIS